MENNIKISELYRHFKGNVYKVICIAKHSGSLEPMVVYKNAYSSDDTYWIRSVLEWNSFVNVDGKEVPRFEHIGIDWGEYND